ncbi:hypothetical protein E2C01_050853 [Portunus trituberculatus]|uniref:Uncharacterized protein n=1 Tax=Portunus trituberculatus TaxID=210409 RepID=A0A5B7GI15_PORTR|nr:hypothetical protein [Portunus trituberculatus]
MHLPHTHPSLKIQNLNNDDSKPSLRVPFWGRGPEIPPGWTALSLATQIFLH